MVGGGILGVAHVLIDSQSQGVLHELVLRRMRVHLLWPLLLRFRFLSERARVSALKQLGLGVVLLVALDIVFLIGVVRCAFCNFFFIAEWTSTGWFTVGRLDFTKSLRDWVLPYLFWLPMFLDVFLNDFVFGIPPGNCDIRGLLG